MADFTLLKINGYQVLLAPCEAESVAVGFFIASGSRHETAATAGISHFIEHMLFKGTPTRKPIDITRAIEGRGGNFNACTSEQATCYFTHMPSEYLAESIDILSDMYFNASIPEEEFQREKSVVIEEIRMYADEPDSVAMENLQRNLFAGDRLGEPVAGSEKSLRPLTPDDLKRYIRTHYLPSNTVIVVAGAFELATATELLRAHLRRRNVARPAKGLNARFVAHPPIPSQLVRKDVQQAQLALGYRTFGLNDPRKYAATVLDAILGRGMSSRLFQEVREKRGLSYDISSRMQFFRDVGMFTVTAGLAADKREAALRTIDRELRRVCEHRVGAAELRRTKEFLIGNFRLSHEKTVSKMFFYGQTLLSFGRVVPTTEQVEGIRAVTADQVMAVAQEIFRPENRSISWVVGNSPNAVDTGV